MCFEHWGSVGVYTVNTRALDCREEEVFGAVRTRHQPDYSGGITGRKGTGVNQNKS